MLIDSKLDFFRDLVSCNYPLYFWVYQPDLTLEGSSCPDEKAMDGIFSLSGCKEYLKQYSKTSDLPVILTDSLGLMWAASFEVSHGQISRVHVMGPAFINQNSLPHIEQELNAHQMSVAMKKQMLRHLEGLPLISSVTFYQYVLMFHYCIRHEKLTIVDLQHQVRGTGEHPAKQKKETDDDSHLGVRNIESKLLQMVEQGNLNYKEILAQAASTSPGVRTNIGNPIQQGKYSSVTFTALCSRAAIAGGLPAPTAYSLNDMYTQAADSCKTLGELAALNAVMYGDFIYRVHKCRQNPEVSVPVQTCCDYITMHITEKFDIQKLADMVGYTEYYLSRKFKKETGVSINSFIKSAKIEHARTMLSTTGDSIQEISEQLNFCSRSYFADTFQKETGMSPSEYREKYRSI